MFEVEVAARLRTSGQVRFAEPDVVVDEGGACFGVACKRPRSLQTIFDATKKAISQIRRNQMPGIVAIDIDVPNVEFIIGPDSSTTYDVAQNALVEASSSLEAPIAEILGTPAFRLPSTPIGGVVLMSRFVAVQPGPEGFSSVIPRWHYYPIADGSPLGDVFMRIFVERLVATEPRYPLFDEG